MKFNDEDIHRLERKVLSIACLILLAITLAGIIWKEAHALFFK